VCANIATLRFANDSADKNRQKGLVKTMRVDLKTYGTESTDNGKTDRSRPTPAPSEQGNATATHDQTHFSFDQTRVKALATQVLAQPEVRQQKVDLLRQSIGKGEYAVSDNQVADAIIADLTSGSAGQLTG
jgi:flagellar biosynthesis anti-sigma factor FlgM